MKPLLKYSLVFFLLLAQLSVAAPQKLTEIKNKIVGKEFPKTLLNEFSFFLQNNKIDFEKERIFLNNLNSTFETEYLQSLILFKNNEFSKAFNKLLSLLDDAPNYYPYYDLLAKTTHITNKQTVITQNNITSKKYKNYLYAQLAYQNTQYKEAKDLFDVVLKIDSTSFEPNFMIAYSYRNLGNYELALKYFNNSAKSLKKDSPQFAKIKIAIGSLFYLSGDYNKAKELYNSGLSLASEAEYNTEKAKALLNIGMLLDLEGAVAKARINFDTASKLAIEIGDNELATTCLSEYAVSYTYTGEETNAREKYEESFLLFKKLGNKKRLALTAINIGNSYLNISNYKNSIRYFNIGLIEAGENVRTKMFALRGLGDVYLNLANYSKALDYYNKAKIIAKEIEDIPANAEIHIGIGVLYYNLDMPSKALKILEESENSLIDSDNPYLKLEVEQKIGIIYSSIDSLSLASSYLKKSADLANKYGDVYSEILSNTFLADINIKQNNISVARPLLQKTMVATKAIEYNQMLGVQNLLLSEISKKDFDVKKEIEYIQKAMDYAKKSYDYNSLILANQKLGDIYETQNNFTKAKQYYLAAIDLIDVNFNRLFTKADIQIKFFSNYYSIYNSLITIYLSEDKFTEAFELLEKSKSRNTSQNLTNMKLNNSMENNELLDKYYDLEWKLTSELYSTEELFSIEREFESVKKSITKISPATEKYFSTNSPLSLNSIQQNLDNGEYIISYFILKDFIYAFQLSSNNLKVEKIYVSKNELSKMKESISPYYDSEIGGDEISFNKDLFAFNAEGSKNFYERVLHPIISDIPVNSKIVFSLPSEMLTVPFELLVIKTDDNSSPYLLDDKRFLINDYIISYTPSALIWNKLKSKIVSKVESALLIGDPFFGNQSNLVAKERGIVDEIGFESRNMTHLQLEYSADEIRSIGSLINNEDTYLSKNATETIFKNNVENASIVHLSTHSFLYKNNPLILFASTDEENDGILEVGEILNLNLNSDLVVLSSCKSGLGKVDKAEGIIGMQKAFFDAGALSVIVSLWDVNDKYTSIFMKYFYSFLSKNMSKSEALQLAKIKFIKENNSNPYYWAAFTLSGNDAPIIFKTKNSLLTPLFILLLLFLVLISYFLFQKKFKTGIVFKNT